MTDLECFRATIARQRPDRILYTAGCTPDLRQRVAAHIGTKDIACHYGFWQPAGLAARRPEACETPDYSRYWEGVELPPDTQISGVGVARVPGDFYHFTRLLSPLRNARSLADIESFPLEDRHLWDCSHWPAAVTAAHEAGQVVRFSVGHMYEDAWQIRGYEEFLLDTIERPAWAECLLERLIERNLVLATKAARAGADFIFCGDDIANQQSLMFSTATWRRLILARWGRLWRTVKEIHPACVIGYHTDGNCSDIVGEMVDAGLDVLNPVQPECLDTDALYRSYGDRLSFFGCIGTQSTMPFGTAEDVRRRVRDCIDAYGRQGGLILAPTHVLEPEVPLANIDAFATACREFGTFG